MQKGQKAKTVGNPILEKYRKKIQKQAIEQKRSQPQEEKVSKKVPSVIPPLEKIDSQVIDYNMLELREPLMLRYQRLLF